MTTLTTPYQEMQRTIWQEFDKCEYWIQKQLYARGKAMLKELAKIKENNKLGGENKPFPFIEYKATSGNRWINYLYDIGMGIKYDSVCYWETYGSFGAFLPFHIDGTPTIIITPSHFWQRVCERTDYKMNGVHTAMSFIENNRAHEHELLPPDEGDTRRKIAIHWNSGTGYGVEVSKEHHIFEVRTFIPENQMSGHKLQERKKATENLLSEDMFKAFENWDRLGDAIGADDAGRFALLDIMKKETAEGIDQRMMKEGQKMMENALADYRSQGMNDEEAIMAYIEHNPINYYINKHGEHRTANDPKMTELNVRLRLSELERLRDQNWKDVLKISQNRAGGKIPKDTQKHLKHVFDTGYLWGWSATMNWSIQELPEGDNATPYQEFKHDVYEQCMKAVGEWVNHNFKDPYDCILKSFATFGFDLAVHSSVRILSQTLGFQNKMDLTVKEYMERFR